MVPLEAIPTAIGVVLANLHRVGVATGAVLRGFVRRLRLPPPVRRVLAEVDALPDWQAAGLGVVCGVGTTLPLLALDTPYTLVPGSVLLAGWSALAVSGAPRVVVREVEAPRTLEPLVAEHPNEPATFANWLEELVEPTPMDDPVLGTLVGLPGGTFWMGSPEGEGDGKVHQHPRHRVQVSALAVGQTPVTRRQWAAVMRGEAPGRRDNAPVNEVTWFDAVRFCNAASEREGLEPCYVEVDGAWVWVRTRNGYRLPTEAEWEYACRAGTQTAYSFGQDTSKLSDYTWFGEISRGEPHPVGQTRPNAWGLYDMYGNVWEWCWDVWGAEVYSERLRSVVLNPVVYTVGRDAPRVIRGGSFGLTSRILRSATRNRDAPGVRNRFLGFRCVRGTICLF